MSTSSHAPNRLTTMVLISMLLGVAVGYGYHELAPDKQAIKDFASNMSLITEVFLRLIKMIMAPLVLATLVSGIAQMNDGKSVGRVGAKAMLWFFCASVISLALGLLMANILQPGINLGLPIPDVEAQSGLVKGNVSFRQFLSHAFPTSIIEAMSKNEILPIVVFSLFFGSAIVTLGEAGKPLLVIVNIVVSTMLKVTNYVMTLAPVAVFAAVSVVVAREGLGIIGTYGKFLGQFYLSILVLLFILITAGFLVLGLRVFPLIKMVQAPMVLAFSTASSESAYPRILEQLEKFGCSKKVAGFVLPIGYSFNLDGSMMYCTFATLFIAQAYGIEVSLTQQISMLMILMLTSKGMAAIPRASLVVIAATLSQFNIPEAGLLLLFGIDHFLDMGRAATNVVGNTIAAAVVAKWEKELREPGGESK